MRSILKSFCAATAVVAVNMAVAEDADSVVPKRVVSLNGNDADTTGETAADGESSTESFSADALSENAAAVGWQADGKGASNYKETDLVSEEDVIPPSTESAKTVEDAVRDILRQVDKQVYTVSSNGIDKLTMPYQQLGDGKGYQMKWRRALHHLLTPHGYNFTEDGDLVLFGLTDEVDAKHKMIAIERLSSNHTPILFTSNDSEGGMELLAAIQDVAEKAGITYTTDYMAPEDRRLRQDPVVRSGELSATDIGNAKEKTEKQQTAIKRTTYDTRGQLIEWRTVLKTILNPSGYDFVEDAGVVKIAKPELIKKWADDAEAAKPLGARVIRLYHADPESVVERVMKIKGLLKNPNASLQATRKKDDDTDVVKNLNARIQTSSGSRSGMSDTSGQVFDKLVRPRTVPAIIAYDNDDNLDNIEAKIKLFDIKEKQILIEAIIFQLDTSNGDGDMDGVQWSGFETLIPFYGAFGKVADTALTVGERVVTSTKSTSLADGQTVVSSAREVADNVTDSISYSTTGLKNGFSVKRGRRAWMRTIGAVDFQSMIQLIREKSNAKLLSSPMIIVGDHSEAAIQVSRVTPVPQIEASSLSGLTSGDNVQNSLNVQWNMIRDGILMWVAPEITEAGDSVRLTVHPQVIDRGERVDLSDLNNSDNKFNEYPVYNYVLTMHEMDTRATVPSGATLMFGGLVKNREEEIETKVRWLGDIPLIGWFFRSKTLVKTQENLIIMIRPTILEDDEQTGFEENTLKEAEPLMKNSGKDLKSTPMEGPYSIKEINNNIKEMYDERVAAPFK